MYRYDHFDRTSADASPSLHRPTRLPRRGIPAASSPTVCKMGLFKHAPKSRYDPVGPLCLGGSAPRHHYDQAGHSPRQNISTTGRIWSRSPPLASWPGRDTRQASSNCITISERPLRRCRRRRGRRLARTPSCCGNGRRSRSSRTCRASSRSHDGATKIAPRVSSGIGLQPVPARKGRSDSAWRWAAVSGARRSSVT
jgi:hypothetical protein